ncbi:thioredoxin family protein [Rufibacter ruber]|uniref:thioredoxin family protein n=1 Tax=Rufibacter ruber TaxID=1783499 RepID=UPI00082ED842|nr:thioredoxin family protein [Rufibacter ruber]
MRYVLFIFAALAFAACSTPRQAVITDATHTGLDPQENREEPTQAGNDSLLIGTTTRVAFEMPRYSAWFHPMYLRYKPNEQIIDQLQPQLEGVRIKVFMGSWCLDSQREIPRFYKVLDAARFPYSRVEMTSLREDKTGLTGEEKTLNITAVPTFIFYKNGKELGRIVETAYPTLEMNMLTVLKDSTATK